MNIFRVGGAVRDRLLGYPHHETDWLVVGSTPEEMIKNGFAQVGRDFPVFLHPESKEEYALARTERKSGPGYHGFVVHAAPSVTLEEDLDRRDLTIYAMAIDVAGTVGEIFTVITSGADYFETTSTLCPIVSYHKTTGLTNVALD